MARADGAGSCELCELDVPEDSQAAGGMAVSAHSEEVRQGIEDVEVDAALSVRQEEEDAEVDAHKGVVTAAQGFRGLGFRV